MLLELHRLLYSVTSCSAPFASLTWETAVAPVFANTGLDSRHVKLKKKQSACLLQSCTWSTWRCSQDPQLCRVMRESTAHRTVGRQLVSIVLCQGSYSPVFCCTLIGRSCQFVSIGQDVSDIQAALQAARCHPQINRVGMDEAVLPSWIMFDIQQSHVCMLSAALRLSHVLTQTHSGYFTCLLYCTCRTEARYNSPAVLAVHDWDSSAGCWWIWAAYNPGTPEQSPGSLEQSQDSLDGNNTRYNL